MAHIFDALVSDSWFYLFDLGVIAGEELGKSHDQDGSGGTILFRCGAAAWVRTRMTSLPNGYGPYWYVDAGTQACTQLDTYPRRGRPRKYDPDHSCPYGPHDPDEETAAWWDRWVAECNNKIRHGFYLRASL